MDSDEKQSEILSLVADLGSEDGLVRATARSRLVGFRGKAIKPLVASLTSKKECVRWEAAKALGQIGNARATRALTKALEDRVFDVRWLAAEALIVMGRKSVTPLLQALVKQPPSVWLREGAHHVLHDISTGDLEEVLKPVLLALEGAEPALGVPMEAKKALGRLISKRSRCGKSPISVRGPGCQKTLERSEQLQPRA